MGRTAGVNLTKAIVEGLKPQATLFRVADAQVRGLFIQVTPGGVLSWVVRFRVHGREKTQAVGRWPEVTVALARKGALELQAKLASGEDPAATRRAEREAETMAELVTRFKKEHLPTLKPSTRKEYERLLDNVILPGLGSKRVKDIQPSDVAAFLSKIRSRTPKGIEANRVRATLSKMFSLAVLWGLRADGVNPAHGQARSPETKKDRHLSDKELVALGVALRHLEPTEGARAADALEAEDAHGLAALRLSLLTGMRKSEIIGDGRREIPALLWTDVDLEAGTIRLGHHKTARRTGARLVVLCGAAVDLLEHLPQRLGNPCVIPGRRIGEPLQDLQGVWVRVRDAVSGLQERAKLPKKARVDLSDVTIHDCRRSFASLATRMGYPELIVAALLGHAAGTVTAGYARMGADPLREVVEAIGGRMAALLAGGVDLEAEAKAMKEEVQARRNGKSA